MRKVGVAIALTVFLGMFFEPVFAAPTATLTSASTVSLKTGESTIVTFNIINDNSFCSVTGYYSLDSQSYSNSVGAIPAGYTKQISMTVSAPPKGSVLGASST